ncbi:MAG: phosphatase PAP2 family protein [Gammaproteobacteria bacterium]
MTVIAMTVDDNKAMPGSPESSRGSEIGIGQVFVRAGLPALFTWVLLLPAYFLPAVDSTRAPYFDLTSEFAAVAYWVSGSGSKFGAPIVGVLVLLLLVTRTGLSGRQRWKEAVLVIVLAAVFAGGGAALNEHGVKEALKIPRPNIVWLAGDNGSGPLGMRADEFYGLGDKARRGASLLKVLEQSPSPVLLAPEIREHWVDETGYSFPSGHSLSAMFFATFLLAMAVSYVTGRRAWLFYLLLPWALAVCYSRPILRVHTPTDIAVGGFEGIVVGTIAWFIARSLLRKFAGNL